MSEAAGHLRAPLSRYSLAHILVVLTPSEFLAVTRFICHGYLHLYRLDSILYMRSTALPRLALGPPPTDLAPPVPHVPTSHLSIASPNNTATC